LLRPLGRVYGGGNHRSTLNHVESRMPGHPFYQLHIGRGQERGDDRHGIEARAHGDPVFGRTLRIALAMKGGVSLAVWIGGAVAELDILRRITILGTPEDPRAYLAVNRTDDTTEDLLVRADAYATLLFEKGYDGVDIDVLAGASAGGLNAVLYGAAQRAGVTVDGVLDVWLESGGIWELLRDPGLESVPSVLQGDAFFWKRVEAAIAAFYASSESHNPAMKSRQVLVDLSATISDPDYRSSLQTREGRGHFHFVGTDETEVVVEGRNIPSVANTDDIARLGYAARSTSSFPGAFEPALIWSHETGSELADGDVAKDGDVDMSFAFNAHRPGAVERLPGRFPYRVIDGGVLDNIPIERALHAIGSLPSPNFATRLILYLDPSPDATQIPAEASEPIEPPNREDRDRRRIDRLSQFVGIVWGGIALRGISESGNEEIEDLERTRRSLFLERARYAALSQAAQTSGYDKRSRRVAYAHGRAPSDVGLLYGLFRDPARWQLESALTHRTKRTPVARELLSNLEEEVGVLYEKVGRHDPEDLIFTALTRGSQALIDAASAGLNWMRALEDHAYQQGKPYFLQQASAPDPRELHRDVREKLYEIAREGRRMRDARFDRILLDARADLAGVAEQWVTLEGVDLSDGKWETLDWCVAQLRLFTKQSPGFELHNSPWSAFPDVPAKDASGDLAPFVAPSGIPDLTTALRFDTISASEKTPLENTEFRRLRHSQLAGVANDWLKLGHAAFEQIATAKNLPPELDSGAKLAGSELANFAAFFSKDWRRNDWWWGHTDAAAGIIRILDALPARIPAATPPTEVIRDAQTAVLRDARAASVSDPEEAMLAGDHSLGNLAPSYLVAITSRTVRVAFRALFGGARLLPRIAGTAILPPILALVPFVVVPLRAAFAASVVAVALGLTLTNGFEIPRGICFFAGVAAVLSAIVATVSEVHAWPRRRKLLKIDEDIETHPIATRLPVAVSRSQWLLAFTLIATILTLLDWLFDRGASMVIFALTAVVLSFVSRRSTRSLGSAPLRRKRGVLWLAVTGAVLLLSLWSSRIEVALWGWSPGYYIVLGLAAAIAAAVLTRGWLDGGFRGIRNRGQSRWILISLGIGVVGALVVLLVTVIESGFAGRPTVIAVWVGAWVCGQVLWWLGEIAHPVYNQADDTPLAPVPYS
jgi:patatin-related protein